MMGSWAYLSSRGHRRAVIVVSLRENREPPRHVWCSLDEGLELLADLEDARDVLLSTAHLVVLVGIERQIRLLSRRLDFDDEHGDADV